MLNLNFSAVPAVEECSGIYLLYESKKKRSLGWKRIS